MKVTFMTAILAACGLVSAFPPNSSGRPSVSRHRCSRYHRPSSTIAPSSSPSSSIVSSSTPISSSAPPSSVISSSSVPASSSSSAPPPVRTCELGTAFGYVTGDATELNTQAGNDCNRWGWFSTPTLAELQAGISGILYVGAGGNNINNAINVGTFTAVASPTGGVTVTYSLTAGYFISEAHIDLDCLPVDTCAPGQYTFNSGAVPNLSVYANPTPIQYPTCSGGSSAYLIVHAKVQFATATTSCPDPVAT